MKVTIGTAPDSWGVWFPDDPRQMPWQQFLDEVTEAGYKWIELGPYGYLPTDLSVLRGELDKRDLKVSGSFITGDLVNPAGGPKLERELRGLGPTLKGLGASFLALIEDLIRTNSPARRPPRSTWIPQASSAWSTRPVVSLK
jgi:inosose dehydratase